MLTSLIQGVKKTIGVDSKPSKTRNSTYSNTVFLRFYILEFFRKLLPNLLTIKS